MYVLSSCDFLCITLVICLTNSYFYQVLQSSRLSIQKPFFINFFSRLFSNFSAWCVTNPAPFYRSESQLNTTGARQTEKSSTIVKSSTLRSSQATPRMEQELESRYCLGTVSCLGAFDMYYQRIFFSRHQYMYVVR